MPFAALFARRTSLPAPLAPFAALCAAMVWFCAAGMLGVLIPAGWLFFALAAAAWVLAFVPAGAKQPAAALKEPGFAAFFVLSALLLARRDEMDAGFTLDTGKVKAFRVPAGVLVEVYATTLHYAPCHVDAREGFRVAVVLPRGTNGPRPSLSLVSPEDALLRARNKWLIAHPESAEAADGAFAGLTGENIDISADI